MKQKGEVGRYSLLSSYRTPYLLLASQGHLQPDRARSHFTVMPIARANIPTPILTVELVGSNLGPLSNALLSNKISTRGHYIN